MQIPYFIEDMNQVLMVLPTVLILFFRLWKMKLAHLLIVLIECLLSVRNTHGADSDPIINMSRWSHGLFGSSIWLMPIASFSNLL